MKIKQMIENITWLGYKLTSVTRIIVHNQWSVQNLYEVPQFGHHISKGIFGFTWILKLNIINY
jgi:hypothetical protein